jgi:hypothetical protein
MLDVQIFCAEESKALQEKLNATLKRAIGMLSTGINPDKVDEGTKQLDSLLEDLEQQLNLLNQQQMEEASANAEADDKDVNVKQIADGACIDTPDISSTSIQNNGDNKINKSTTKQINNVKSTS